MLNCSITSSSMSDYNWLVVLVLMINSIFNNEAEAYNHFTTNQSSSRKVTVKKNISVNADAELKLVGPLEKLRKLLRENHFTDYNVKLMIKKIQNNTAHSNQLKQCYISNYGDDDLNVFKLPLKVILYKYFSNIKNRFLLLDKKQISTKLKTLARNIVGMLTMVFKCVTGKADQMTTYGLTSLTHMDKQNYNAMMNKLYLNVKNYTAMLKSKVNQCRGSDEILPITLDYRDQGVVTKVKNQLGCSSCFIFSAIATVESAYLLKKKNQTGKNNATGLEPLYSEQAVLDCCDPGSCSLGGLPHHTFDILKKNGVIDENVAPYTDSQKTCKIGKYPTSKFPIKVTNYCYRYNFNTTILKSILAKNGPVVVAVDTDDIDEWMHIKGKFRRPCGNSVTHAVTLVGWNKEDWIIKNSWGEDWGINGYLYMPLITENKCGINTLVSHPFVEI